MKYGSASFGVLLVDGINMLGAKPKNVSQKIELLTEQTNGLGDSHEEHTPTGMTRATFSQDGALFDDGTNSMHAALKAHGSASRIVCVADQGNVIGQPFTGCVGETLVGYEVLVTNGALAKANAAYQISGDVEEGIVVQSHAQKSADWNTHTDGVTIDQAANLGQRVIPITSNSAANPSIVTTPTAHGLASGAIVVISGVAGSTPTINGERTVTVIDATHFSVPVNVTVAGTGGSLVRGDTPSGGAGYLEVSELTGLTGFVGKIRDSPDNVTFADLATFANVTAAPTAQRVAVSGTVDRYLSFDGNVTGTGTITPFAGFARA
jgi:hypothetical protein